LSFEKHENSPNTKKGLNGILKANQSERITRHLEKMDCANDHWTAPKKNITESKTNERLLFEMSYFVAYPNKCFVARVDKSLNTPLPSVCQELFLS
jgi:hypothetical protein